MRHVIEACCTGNNGRSPMVEVIGNKEILTRGLEEKVIFISSGTRADHSWDNVWHYEKAKFVLQRAARSGLMIEPAVIDKGRYDEDTDYQISVNKYARKMIAILRPIETALRNAALLDIGIEYKGGRRQTRAGNNVSLVLGITNKHVRHVKEFYQGEEKIPEIMQLHEYAGIPGEIPDAFGQLDPGVYREIRDEILDLMPTVVERFKSDHNL